MISNGVAALIVVGTLLSESATFSSDKQTANSAIGIGKQALDLFEARERWGESSISKDYFFEFKRSCFCKDNSSIHRVIVRNGMISSVEAIFQYRRSETARLETYPTISQLFDQIGDLILKSADPDTSLIVEYDNDKGYPRRIAWRNASVRDGDWTVTVANLDDRS